MKQKNMEIKIEHLGEQFTIKKEEVGDSNQLYEMFDKIAILMGYDAYQKNSLDFEKVIKFQDIFSVNADSLNMEESDLRVSLILEELEELKEAFKTKDKVEVLDAYMDVIFLAIGGLIRHGYRDMINKAFNEVCDSNLSKYDETLKDARLTESQYESKGIETYSEYSDKHNVIITKRYSDGKVLKSHNFKSPNLSQFLF